MTYVSAGRTSEPAVNFGLERQQRKNVIDIVSHHPCPPGPPSPDRRRDVFDDWNFRLGGAHAPCDAAGKARAVDDDQNVRAFFDDGSGGEAHEAQDSRQPARNGAKADDGKIVDGIEAREPLPRHIAAADAGETHRSAGALAQRAH